MRRRADLRLVVCSATVDAEELLWMPKALVAVLALVALYFDILIKNFIFCIFR